MNVRILAYLFLTVTLLTGCLDEDLDDDLLIQVDLIAKESELYELLNDLTEEESDLTCVEFLYSFTILIYDENNTQDSTQIVSNDEEFFNLLQSLEDGFSIGLSFPITSILEDGSTFEIQTPEQLQESLAECKDVFQETVIGECNTIVEECVWEVAIPDDLVYSTYIDAVFDVNNDGSLTFFYRGVEYNGTWIFYFIEDELHLNINLEGETIVNLDWNFDWKVSSYNSEEIQLFNDNGDAFILNRECDEANYCTLLTFTECEFEDQPGFSEFDLLTYVDCIITIAAPQPEIDDVTGELPPPIDWQLSFYNSQEDAELPVNAIETTITYLNSMALETLYVRIENPETLEFIVMPIELEAILCE